MTKNVWGYYVYFPKEQLEDYLKLDFQEYLNIYYSETPEHWSVLKNGADIAFAADTDEKKVEVLKNNIFMTDFDYSLMHEKYSLLCTMSLPFDEPPSENYFNNMGLLELASKFEHGQNACRNMLYSPIKFLNPM